MRIGCNAFRGMFSNLQTLFFQGVCDEASVRHHILNRSVAQTYAQTDPCPSSQRSDNPSAWRYDWFIRRYWFIFNFRTRHIPSE